METIFDSALLPREDRFRAWQENICDYYVNVDAVTRDPLQYYGWARASRFGTMALAEIMGSSQMASRRPKHLMKLDKDYVYLQFVLDGTVDVVQSGVTSRSLPGAASIFDASAPYDLVVPDKFRSLFVEIPREHLASRFPAQFFPEAGSIIPTEAGIGRITMEFCRQVALESAVLDEATKAALGVQMVDIVALTLNGSRANVDEDSIQQVRLRSIKAFIEKNLESPTLSPSRIADSNDVSLSYLHYLFKDSGYSVFEWVWHRRLECCYQMITAPQHRHRTIADIAEAMGFSNPSHFSNAFRKEFGIRPSDLRRPGSGDLRRSRIGGK